MKRLRLVLLILIFGVPTFGRGLETTYFGKKLDLVDWNQKAALSLPDLVRAVQKEVDLYRFEIPNQKEPAVGWRR